MGARSSRSASPGVCEKIKAVGAVRLVAKFAGGETKPIAIPDVRRGRWLRLKALLDTLGPWLQLEAYDKHGALLAVIDNPDEPDELESLEAEYATDDARQLAPLLGLMLKAQDVALSRQQAMLKTVLEGNAALLQLVSDRLVSMERAYQAQLDRTTTYAEALADVIAKHGGDDGEDAEMSALVALLPRLLAKQQPAQKPAPKANGAP